MFRMGHVGGRTCLSPVIGLYALTVNMTPQYIFHFIFYQQGTEKQVERVPLQRWGFVYSFAGKISFRVVARSRFFQRCIFVRHPLLEDVASLAYFFDGVVFC